MSMLLFRPSQDARKKEQYFAIEMAYFELPLHIKLGNEYFITAKITHFSFNAHFLFFCLPALLYI